MNVRRIATPCHMSIRRVKQAMMFWGKVDKNHFICRVKYYDEEVQGATAPIMISESRRH